MSRNSHLLPSLRDIAAMDRPALLDLWRRIQPASAPRNLSQPILRKALAFEVQCRTKGGPARSVLRRLDRAGRTDAAVRTPTLPIGTQLLRDWNGRSYRVSVTETGFRMDDAEWTSLSAIARHITGAHWSGPRFFGLTGSANRTPRSARQPA